ncbi:MAG: DNA primase [bacterium]|nr:DNA primase [bacterium]
MDQIEEIRSKVDIVQLISEYLPLQKSGRNFKAICPFHAEKTPSMMVSPERQIFKCFGCQKGGSAFNFLMEMEGMEFGEALRALAKRTGVKLDSYRPTSGEAEKDKLYEINHLAGEFYHYLLLSHPSGKRALTYLLERGIKKESLEVFKIGYAPAMWDGLQKFLVGKKGYKIEDLMRIGLAVGQSNYRDFFRDRVIFPLKDHRGNVVGFAGRVIGAWHEEEARQTGPKYINTPESVLYHKSDLLFGLEVTRGEIKTQNEAVVVEGELDLVSSYQAGLKNVVAIKGSALTEAQCRLLKRFCENLTLALDRDIAGDQAARRGIKVADNLGLATKIARIPEGKDPDELARKNPQLLLKTIKEALPVYDFLFESAFSRFDAREAEGKRKIGQELILTIKEIADEIMKNHYLRLLSKRLGVTEESIERQMNKTENQKELSSEGPGARLVKPRRELLEERLLGLTIQAMGEKLVITPKIKKVIASTSYKRLVGLLGDFSGKGKFSSEKFAESIPIELVEIFNNFYLNDFGRQLTDKRWVENETEKILREIEEVDLREKIKKMSVEIERLEREGTEKEVESVKKQFSELCRKLGKVA